LETSRCRRSAGQHLVKQRSFNRVYPLRWRRARFWLLPGRRWLGSQLKTDAQIGTIHVSSYAQLIGHPKKVPNRDREAKVIIALDAPSARRRNSQPAANQAQKLAAQVRHDGAAVAWIQCGLNLDQTAKLA
jgi:hypothetical protein